MKNAAGATGDGRLVEVRRGEAGVEARGVMLAEDRECMFAFAENVVDFLESGKVAVGKAFLIGNENIGLCRAQPAGEDALEEDVGIKDVFAAQPLRKQGDLPAMADGNFVTGSGGDLMDQVDVAVQSDSIGTSDEV